MKPNSILPMISWKLGQDGTCLCTVAVRDTGGRNCRKGHLVIMEGYISVFVCSHALEHLACPLLILWIGGWVGRKINSEMYAYMLDKSKKLREKTSQPSNEIAKNTLRSLTVFPRFLCWFLAFTRLLFTLKNAWVLPLMLLFRCKSDTGFMWGMESRRVFGIFRFYFIFISYSVKLQRCTSFLILKRNPSDKLSSLEGEEFCQNQDERCLSAVVLMY